MKGLIADYSDDSDSEQKKPESPPSKPAKRHEPEKSPPATPTKPAVVLPFNDEPSKKPDLSSDSELSDGDFVQKAKKNKKVELEQPDNAQEKSTAPSKPEIEGLDPVAKSLFSVLPPPKNKKPVNPIVLPKVKPKETAELIRDEDEQDFLLTYNNVQLPKAEVKYSTDIKARGEDSKRDVIEVNESDIRDNTWKMNYMKSMGDMQESQMEEYLQEHPIGKEERSKNQITHLAYQAIKQQMAQRYANVQKTQKDGRKKYGW